MFTEHQQEEASLYALGALTAAEQAAFEDQLRSDAELREFVNSLKQSTRLLAMAVPTVVPPPELRNKVLHRVDSFEAARPATADPPERLLAGLRFIDSNDATGWKPLAVAGAWIK